MSANVYGTVNLLHLDSVRDALEERDKRIAELEAEVAGLEDLLINISVTHPQLGPNLAVRWKDYEAARETRP